MSFAPPCCGGPSQQTFLSLWRVSSHTVALVRALQDDALKLLWIQPRQRRPQRLHEAWVGLDVQHLTLFTLLHSVLTDSPECRDDLLNTRTLTASCLFSASLKAITVKQACVKTSHLTASGALLERECGGFINDGEVKLKWAQNFFLTVYRDKHFFRAELSWDEFGDGLRSKMSPFSSL